MSGAGMAEIPPVRTGRRPIDGYGNGRFRIAGEVHIGSILVLPETVAAWSIGSPSDLSAESLAPVLRLTLPPEILLIGCGPRAAMIAPALRQILREAGIVTDAMDTGAACRTFNVLLAEERRVVAALIAVD